MKLLARLRDLKLSLMGTLSMLSALKADHMINALGVGSTSLLDGAKDDQVSREVAEEVKETRKLAGISASISPKTTSSAPETDLTPSITTGSADRRSMDAVENEAEQSGTSRSVATSLTSAS